MSKSVGSDYKIGNFNDDKAFIDVCDPGLLSLLVIVAQHITFKIIKIRFELMELHGLNKVNSIHISFTVYMIEKILLQFVVDDCGCCCCEFSFPYITHAMTIRHLLQAGKKNIKLFHMLHIIC